MDAVPNPELSDSQRLVVIETLLREYAKTQTDHESRLRRLEKILYIGIGLAASLGSAAGSFIGRLPV